LRSTIGRQNQNKSSSSAHRNQTHIAPRNTLTTGGSLHHLLNDDTSLNFSVSNSASILRGSVPGIPQTEASQRPTMHLQDLNHIAFVSAKPKADKDLIFELMQSSKPLTKQENPFGATPDDNLITKKLDFSRYSNPNMTLFRPSDQTSGEQMKPSMPTFNAPLN
jgi:hypothetical protein